jgi:WW domain
MSICYPFFACCLMGKWLCRLPPSENGEWWEISDESRGGIPYYYHTKTGETVWEKPDGFVIPLTVLQVRTCRGFVHPDFKLSSIRIPPSVAAFQSPFPRPSIRSIRPRPHVQQHKRMRNVPWLTVLVHTRRSLEVLFKLLVACIPLQAAPPPPRKRIQMLLPYGVTLLPIPTTEHPPD